MIIFDFCLLRGPKIDYWLLFTNMTENWYWLLLIFRTKNWLLMMVDFQDRKLMDYPEVRITMMIESTAESTTLRKVFNISIFGGLSFNFQINQHTSFGSSLSSVFFPCIRFAQLRTTYPTMTTTIFCDRRQYPNREMAEFEKNWNIEMIHTFRCIISPNDVIIWISSSYSLTNICFNASPMHFKFSIIVMFLHKSVTM